MANIPQERWNAIADARYMPKEVTGNGPGVDSAIKIAHALDYIAAQLGILNEWLRENKDILQGR